MEAALAHQGGGVCNLRTFVTLPHFLSGQKSGGCGIVES